MVKNRNWFSFLEFVDPSDASRANAGLCGAQSAVLGCSPLQSQAQMSSWWDVLRPKSDEKMLSLLETKKFRVLPHACDRDYQHMHQLSGCAPSFSLAGDQRGLLGYVDIPTGRRMIPSVRKSTYVQTFDRNGFSVVGMGKIPFEHIMGSAYRKTGFLSTDKQIYDPQSKKSLFVQCSSLEQCFVDKYFYNGKMIANRRVIGLDPGSQTPVKQQRDWKPSEAENCGIFGIEVTNYARDLQCPGINKKTQSCCMLDVAVAPLYYLLKKVPGALDDLDRVCNKDLLLGKIPKGQYIFSRDVVQTNLDMIQDTYLVPKNDRASKKLVIDGIKTSLNTILDEFTPEFELGTSFQYLQVMDCSLKLYEKLQEHTTCQNAEEAFCTDYATGSPRLGLYYFLDFTMSEVPFAWWHKCMLLHRKTFGASVTSSGIIQCPEWETTSIPKDKMNLVNYAGINARDRLLRAEGGMTSSSVLGAVTKLKQYMGEALTNFISRGRSGEDKGAPADTNLKCFTKARLPMDNRFKAQTQPQDCIITILTWIHIYGEDIEMWPFQSKIASYWKSKAKACFVFHEADLKQLTYSEHEAVPPFSVVQNFLDKKDNVMQETLLQSDLQYNDFFVQKHNSAVDGFLIAELAPSLMQINGGVDLPETLQAVFEKLDLATNPEMFSTIYTSPGYADPDEKKDYMYASTSATQTTHNFDQYPCVTVQDIASRLPTCSKNAWEPVPLTTKHCDDMELRVLTDIFDYAKGREKYPSDFPKKEVSFDHMRVECKNGNQCRSNLKYEPVCYWDCEDNKPLKGKDVLGISLDEDSMNILMKLLNFSTAECHENVKVGGHTYTDKRANASRSQDGSGSAISQLKRKNTGVYLQEVCGYEYKLCQAPALGDYNECEQFSKWDASWKGNPKDVASSYQQFFEVQDTYQKSTAYVCKMANVRSTGSAALDSVRSKLSYNDIVVSMDSELFLKQPEVKRTAFLGRVYAIIADDVWKSIGKNFVEERTCIRCPSRPSADGLSLVDTQVMDPSFFVQVNQQKCLLLATVKGLLDCKFYLGDGLVDDVKYIQKYMSTRKTFSLKTNGTDTGVGWNLDRNMILDPNKDNTTEYNKVVYTLLVRSLMAMLENKESSTSWMKPEAVPFFDNHSQFWHTNFPGFNIRNELDFDNIVGERGQNCQGDLPQIKYGQCSQDFTSLYTEAANSFAKYARKHGSTIVPAKSVLVWPGLSFGFHTSKSIPAWSLPSSRTLQKTFAKWIFDKELHCRNGNVVNTICASTGLSGIHSNEAVNPWLGGDYNPWYHAPSQIVSSCGYIQVAWKLTFLFMAGNHVTPLLTKKEFMRRSLLLATRPYANH